MSLSLFAASSPPTTSSGDTDAYSMGLEFYVDGPDHTLTHINWWQPTTGASTADRTVGLFFCDSGTSGTLVTTPVTATPVGTGWQSVALATPYPLVPFQHYRATVLHPGGQYAATALYFDHNINTVMGGLIAPGAGGALSLKQASFTASGTLVYPASSTTASYWIDVVVEPPSSVAGGFALTLSGDMTTTGFKSNTARTGNAMIVSGVGIAVDGGADVELPHGIYYSDGNAWWPVLDFGIAP